MLAFSREGYTKSKINPIDLADVVFFRGFWNFIKAHRQMAWDEIKRSFSKRLFCQSLQRLVPAIQASDLEPEEAGVRAQAMLSDGTLIQDFHFVERPRVLHVPNAPGPGATASLAIGESVSRKALATACVAIAA